MTAETLSAAVSSAVRVEILIALRELREASPTEVHQFLITDPGARGRLDKVPRLSLVAYHFTKLHGLWLLDRAGERPGRGTGATEHRYTLNDHPALAHLLDAWQEAFALIDDRFRVQTDAAAA